MTRSMSSSSVYQQETSSGDKEGQRHNTMRMNNDMLVDYIDQVKKLRNDRDTLDSISVKSSKAERTIEELKYAYEAELVDWRSKYEEVLSLLNKARIDVNNLDQDKKKLVVSVGEKEKLLKDREDNLSSMEAEINELFTKLNMLQSDKVKLADKSQILLREGDKMKLDLEATKKALDKEKVRAGELENKLVSVNQATGFKIQVLEKELLEERRKNHMDMGNLDATLKGNYEARLKKEIKVLRAMFEQKAEKAKEEYMLVHSRKLAELQELLNRERSTNNADSMQLKDCMSRIDAYKRKIEELERQRLELEQRMVAMDESFIERDESAKAQIHAKTSEITSLQHQINIDRAEYEKQYIRNKELDDEIEMYREILQREYESLKKGEGIVIEEDSSASSSDEEKKASKREKSIQKKVSRTTSQDTTDGGYRGSTSFGTRKLSTATSQYVSKTSTTTRPYRT